ncbi:MAG: bifunctional 5,10-methylenetetrahydrofolate dehydrogenase/5,10-methenyltetrahydrofolate cyclohydrolase [Bacteroidia bacterium]|nr:bifunctional 5,10-methylenetetrahydrofolate dehydrogenase/5,10-methenyltetrahydrofolate cyclohydrolase [Bacteroidia bacterium]
MTLLDGKVTSQTIKDNIAGELQKYLSEGRRKPHLVAILVGNDGASQTYVASKQKNSQAIGFDSTVYNYDETITEEFLLDKINQINNDEAIDGLIVQLPLPKHISESKVTQAIKPEKDVDGFHDVNMGKLAKGDEDGFIPATPYGIVKILEAYDIQTSGKHCVVVGRSNIVGRPMSILMSANSKYGNCTVTLCHSRTANIEDFTKKADILIVALGKPEFITGDMIKPGAVVIDVGISRVEDPSKKSGFALKGDVHFESASEVSSAITPVPGGVGLMTIAGLLLNTFKSYKQYYLKQN